MSQQTLVELPLPTQIVELFVQDCRDREMTADSIQHYRSVVLHFFEFLDKHGISPYRADKQVFIEYLRNRKLEGVGQKTLENNFTALASFYEFLVFQDYVEKNPVTGVRKRYLRRYKNENDVDAEAQRKLISVEEMSLLLNSVLDTRDKAILTLLAKTGVRRGELIAMDVTDIDWVEQSITLKKFKKRSGRTVFFDDETSRLLKRWLNQRQTLNASTPALFIGEHSERLRRHGISHAVVKYAEKVGLHDPKSSRLEDHFSPHCFRHWFTTHLRRAGMDREFIKALRGDRRREAIDIYDRIDRQELRRAYLAFIPQLGL
ncbi:MAG TPA: tyrosine-type recombinase/integrase [Candidatus Acidoferrum sp.]|nr:tyrosine-type recombinase/integrase [Candidatus Acidoferrum sp.]